MFVVAAASIALNAARPRSWSATLAADASNSLDQALELSHVVAPGAGQSDREQDVHHFRDEAVFRTG